MKEETNNISPTRKMADNLALRLKYAQRGRVLRGIMKSLGIRISDMGREIDVSQGHLSQVLETYCDLQIYKCEEYLKKVEAALAKRGVLVSENDRQLIVVYDRDEWQIDFDIPKDQV